mmetsp:Transcript_7435/g.20387  ORF Transcript_7435/g.20387 Transcript_7435/m.20387 type:complete len:88 (-) Transcript_7435:100-363(-)
MALLKALPRCLTTVAALTWRHPYIFDHVLFQQYWDRQGLATTLTLTSRIKHASYEESGVEGQGQIRLACKSGPGSVLLRAGRGSAAG